MKNPTSYLKMQVLGAVEGAPGQTSHARILHVADLTFTDEEGNRRRFTWRTIQTWMYRYRKHGITGVTSPVRRDKGQTRKVAPEEVLEAIQAALPHFNKGYTRTAIYRHCIAKGLLRKEQVAYTTFMRLIKEYDLLDKAGGSTSKKRLAFAMRYANELWQADTMYGPHVPDGSNGKQRTFLIAFIDDASRVLCHGEFFFNDSTESLIRALRSALYKRGTPEQLYVDNGSNYTSQEITLICARVGCILRHTPVRDGAAKGKIERFFRRVRDQFLCRKLDLSSLAALNRQFTAWVEEEYNSTIHSAINMRPIDRFGLDLKRIRFLPPCEATEELFYAEEERTVKKDNTFSFKTVRYETPVDLRGKKIIVRYNRATLSRLVIYYKQERMGEAKMLNAIANGQLRRGRNGRGE